VDPGVQTWVRFKQKAEQLALGHYGKARENLSGSNSTSHEYDIQNGASYALQNLSPSQLARAAGSAGDVLVKEFGTTDPRKWRAKRLMYKWSVQGAASPPDLPFFDRGTWEQSVELGP
jgi:penicillin G amidase